VFELCNFHVFAGTTDPYPLGETMAGHMYLGYNLNDAKPSYASGLIDCSTGGFGVVQFPTSTTLTTWTAVQSASRVSTLGNYQAILSKVQSYANWTPYLELDGYPRVALGGSDRGTQGAGLWARTDSGLHVLTTVYDGTDIRLYIDNLLVCPPITVSSSGTIADLWGLVNGASQYAGYEWNAVALYDRALDETERADAYAALVARAAQTGNTITQPTRLYFAEGDSITALTGAGTGASAFGSYAYQYGQNAVAGTRGAVLASGGATLSTLTGRAATTDSYLVTGKTNILSVLVGANDLYNYTGGGAQYATDVAAYCDARRAAGWKVVVGTVLPRSDAALTAGEIATHNTERAVFNAAVRLWEGVHCDGVMDFAANATIGEDGDSDNTTYYSDKLHPNVTGHAVMEGIARTVLDAI
jgi:lysophospholipase L1-like esterase